MAGQLQGELLFTILAVEGAAHWHLWELNLRSHHLSHLVGPVFFFIEEIPVIDIKVFV